MSLWDRIRGQPDAGSVTWLEVRELSRLLDGEAAPLVIDVRGADEFAGPLGHIPVARNIPLDQIPARVAELVGTNQPLVLVCHTDRRSAVAAEHLRRAGRTDTAVLRGGMVAWRQATAP